MTLKHCETRSTGRSALIESMLRQATLGISPNWSRACCLVSAKAFRPFPGAQRLKLKRLPTSARRKLMWLLVPPVPLGVLAPSPVGPVGPVQLGMCINIADADAATVGREFDLMAAMKVTWIRADVDWSLDRNQRGKFDWAYTDRVVQAASARHMNVVALIAYTPT